MYGTGKFVDFQGFRIWVYDDDKNTVFNKDEHEKYLRGRVKAQNEETGTWDELA